VLCCINPRFAELDPEVDRALKQQGVYLFSALPAAPERTCTMLMRTEQDVWLVGVGGNEGAYPGRSPEELMDFANKVCVATNSKL
jgi:hypothetical protein